VVGRCLASDTFEGDLQKVCSAPEGRRLSESVFVAEETVTPWRNGKNLK
jgi:hypothetical protein